MHTQDGEVSQKRKKWWSGPFHLSAVLVCTHGEDRGLKKILSFGQLFYLNAKVSKKRKKIRAGVFEQKKSKDSFLLNTVLTCAH